MRTSARAHLEADVVVVGAGAAGLATASMLGRRGLSSIILEAGQEPGQRWVERYEGLHLNTVRWLSDLPGVRMDRRAARFPSRLRWVAYLREYARQRRLAIRFETTVGRIDPDGDGGWSVQAGDDAIACRRVVLATGHDAVPVIPEWEGRAAYEGRLVHAAEFKRAEAFAGSRGLVVGTGNSGCEIAALLARGGAAKVWLSRRTQPLMAPESFLGVSITAWGLALSLAPDRVIDGSGQLLHWLRFRDLARYGLGPPGKRLSAMRHRYYSPPVHRGIADAVRSGAVAVVDALDRFEGTDVVLADGSRLRPDVVVAATGYRPGLEGLVGHLGVLRDDGEPRVGRDRQSVAAPGLYFAGFSFGLLALLPYVELDARAIARSVAHEHSRPG